MTARDLRPARIRDEQKTASRHGPPDPIARRNRLAGVGLIEVLVALTVLSVGLLGVAAMQVLALRNNTSAADRSMAVILSYSIIDSLRANRETAMAGAYTLALPETGCELPAAGTLATNDLRAWLDAMALRDEDNGVRGVMGAEPVAAWLAVTMKTLRFMHG